MPSPVGHLLAGGAIYLAGTNKRSRSTAILTVTLFSSIAPDFDFVPGILIGTPAAFHHGVSHSLPFAVFYGALVFLIAYRFFRELAATAGALGALAYLSHLILDFVSVTEAGRGIPVLWPLLHDRLGINLKLFGHFHHEGLNHGIWSVVRWDNVPAVLRELVVMGIPVLLLLWRDQRVPNRADTYSIKAAKKA